MCESVIVGFMKRFLLISAMCVLAVSAVAPVAFSQEANVITIIREDGSKEVIPLEPAPAVPEPVQRAPRVEVETRPAPQAAPKAVPRAAAPKIAPTIERVAKPSSRPKIKPTVKPQARKVRKDALALIPPRKPHRQVLPAGEVITKDKALYIALNEAPPSRDVQVYSVQGDRGAAYSVLFKTEEGAYEVLVDAGSGVILSSGAVQVEQSYVKPGHLPARPVPY